MTHRDPRRRLAWLVLCSLACAADDPKRASPADLPDAAADAGTGSVPGTPTLGCRSASDCSASDGRAVECVAISSDFRACALAPPAPAGGVTHEVYDECDRDRPCAAGACYTLPVAATDQCAPGGFDVYNVCVSDECTSDAECAGGGFCAPSGVAGTRKIESYPARHCVPAACKQSAECTARPGGICALVRDGCSPLGSQPWGFTSAQLACVYPDGCTPSSDCPAPHSCSVVDGAAVCL